MARSRARAVQEPKVVAYRGFHVDSSNMVPVVATRDFGGNLRITQGDRQIAIPKHAIATFQRAVADIKDI